MKFETTLEDGKKDVELVKAGPMYIKAKIGEEEFILNRDEAKQFIAALKVLM